MTPCTGLVNVALAVLLIASYAVFGRACMAEPPCDYTNPLALTDSQLVGLILFQLFASLYFGVVVIYVPVAVVSLWTHPETDAQLSEARVASDASEASRSTT